MNLDAKEKAEELFDKFFLIKDDVYNECRMRENEAKKCALIAVDEIISIKILWFQKDTKDLDFWQEEKQEIEKL